MRPRVEVVAIEANSTMMDLYALHKVKKKELSTSKDKPTMKKKEEKRGIHKLAFAGEERPHGLKCML